MRYWCKDKYLDQMSRTKSPEINAYTYGQLIFDKVQFSHSVMSDSLRPHEPQHTRPPCPSPTAGVYPDSCPLSWWCHLAVSSSVVPFSSCPQSFPAAGSFQISQLFTSGGQSIGVSASTSVLPMNTQDWSPLGWTGWISLQSNGLSKVPGQLDIQIKLHIKELSWIPISWPYTKQLFFFFLTKQL